MTAAPISRPAFSARLHAALGAFLAPERLLPPGNDNGPEAHAEIQAGSLTDPLALPPEWHRAGDLIALSFLPFER